jgi:hypothetical protein
VARGVSQINLSARGEQNRRAVDLRERSPECGPCEGSPLQKPLDSGAMSKGRGQAHEDLGLLSRQLPNAGKPDDADDGRTVREDGARDVKAPRAAVCHRMPDPTEPPAVGHVGSQAARLDDAGLLRRTPPVEEHEPCGERLGELAKSKESHAEGRLRAA